jgi:hypothetical protein
MNTTQLSKLQDMVANYHNTNVGQAFKRKMPQQSQDGAQLSNPMFQNQMQGSAQVLPQGPNRVPGGDNINPMQARAVDALKQGMNLGQPRPGMMGPGAMPVMNTPSSQAMQAVKSTMPMPDAGASITNPIDPNAAAPQGNSQIHPTHQQFLQNAIGAGFSPDLVMQFLRHKVGFNPNQNGGQ